MPPKRLTFTREPDHQVEELAGAVLAGLNGNKAFPAPPLDLATVQTQLTDFTTSVSAASQGGPHATAVKKKKRHALLASLRQLALYVQSNCNDDMATLLSSGFLAASTSNAQSKLPKPVITTVDQGNSGQAIVKVKAIRNAKSYDVRLTPLGTGGVPGTAQDHTGFSKRSRAEMEFGVCLPNS
jgi:hypothetical protein